MQNVLRSLDADAENVRHHHILDEINEDNKNYFKFTFVRNPWARLVSQYYFNRSKNDKDGLDRTLYRNSTFLDFVKSNKEFYLSSHWCSYSPTLEKLHTKKYPFVNQIDWITNQSGEIQVDFVGKLENLQDDFNIVCDKIGIPSQKLPHKNKSKHKHYTEYYNEETKQIVAEKYARDIEYFGYKFGE
jgi:hypothetical protein